MAFPGNPKGRAMYCRMLSDPAYMAQKEAEMWARNDPDGKIRGQFPEIYFPDKVKKGTKTKKATTGKATKVKAKKIDKLFSPKKNFQGFPLKDCIMEKSIKKHVFVPKRYGEATRDDNEEHVFCEHCHLKPCITLEHCSDMAEKTAELSIEKGLSYLTIVTRIETLMRGYLRKYFGREYVRNHPLPDCIHHTMPSLEKYMKQEEDDDDDSSQEEDGEDWGSEFEFQ